MKNLPIEIGGIFFDIPKTKTKKSYTHAQGGAFLFWYNLKFDRSSMFIIALIMIWGVFFPSSVVKAESIDFEPAVSLSFFIDKNTYSNPNYIDIDLKLNLANQSANLVFAPIEYDPAYLEIEYIDRSESNCDLEIIDKIDNQLGQYTLACGNPHNLSSGDTLAKIRFNKLDNGPTILRFLPDAAVFSADGTATNILLAGEIHKLYLVK